MGAAAVGKRKRETQSQNCWLLRKERWGDGVFWLSECEGSVSFTRESWGKVEQEGIKSWIEGDLQNIWQNLTLWHHRTSNVSKFSVYFLCIFNTLPSILLLSLCCGSACPPLPLLQLRYIKWLIKRLGHGPLSHHGSPFLRLSYASFSSKPGWKTFKKPPE